MIFCKASGHYNNGMQVTRRQLLGSAVLVPVVLPLANAQEAAPDWNEVSRAITKRNTGLLEKIDVPLGTEPAFVFRP